MALDCSHTKQANQRYLQRGPKVCLQVFHHMPVERQGLPGLCYRTSPLKGNESASQELLCILQGAGRK